MNVAVEWEPNAPMAVLVQSDEGRTCLAVVAHFDDPDQRAVVLVWERCLVVEMGLPNDEGRHEHRLYGLGLGKLLWLGEVLESERLAGIAGVPRSGDWGQSVRHFVVPLKECLVEVLGGSVEIRRCPGTTAQAAFAALVG